MKDSAASVERVLRTRVRQLPWSAAAAALVVLLLAAGYLWLAWREIESAALEQEAMYSRVLELQTASALDSLSATLHAVGKALDDTTDAASAAGTQELLANAVARQPMLRSLSLLNAQGEVVASSMADNLGHRVDRTLLGDAPEDGSEALGNWLPVRDLSDPLPAQTNGSRRQGISALPMLRSIRRPVGTPLLLVGIINPEAFATQHAVLIGDAAETSALWSYDGRLLVRGNGVPLAAGERYPHLAPFARYLPAQEHAAFVGVGMSGASAVAAFRTLRRWPVVAMIERPYGEVLAQLLRRARWVGAAALLAWLGLGAIALLMRRGLRNQIQAQAALAGAHAEMARSEERWKFALEGAGAGVWDWDIKRGTVECSPRWNLLLGHAAGSQLSLSFSAWIALAHPEDKDRLVEALTNHLKRRSEGMHCELRMRCGDGSHKWMLLRGMVTPQRDVSGRPLRLIGTLNDIHEQHTAEEALAVSQARRLAVMQSALDAIVTVDLSGHVIDFNPAAERMFGRRYEEVVGRAVDRLLVAPADRHDLLRHMAEFRETGTASVMNRRLEVDAMRSDGKAFPIELTAIPVQAGGQALITATMRDISDRRWAERALRDSEARARATFEQVAVGVLQQASDRRFLRVNQTLCRMLGYEREEFLNLSADALIHPDDIAPGVAEMQQLFAGNIQNFSHEKRYRRKDGRYVWVRLTASLARDDEGRALYMIGIVEDIEAQRRTQEDLQAARRRELQIGARIQQSLLVTGPAVALAGVSLSSYNLASQEVDGDFFEAIRPGEHCIDLIAGDVMGKGVNAALMGAAVKMQFSRSLVELTMRAEDGRNATPEPAQILESVHRAMTPHLQALDTFVTLCYLRIDLSRGLLSWVGCGHEEAMLVLADGSTRLLSNQQPPLGILADARFSQDSIPVGPGDALLMHSDGVSDALAPDGERVGHERLHQTFRRLSRTHGSPTAVLTRLRQSLLQRSTMTDDVTLVTVRIDDPANAPARLEVPARASSIAAVRGLLAQGIAGSRMSEGDAGLFTVAVVEVFTNIFRHGQGLVEDAPVEILMRRTMSELVVELVYVGEKFEPPEEIPPTNFDVYPEGGFGLTIIRNGCDQVEYAHHEGVNTMRMLRWLEPVLLDEPFDILQS